MRPASAANTRQNLNCDLAAELCDALRPCAMTQLGGDTVMRHGSPVHGSCRNSAHQFRTTVIGASCVPRCVPPVNSDQFDKLGFVAHQSFAFRTCSNGLFRLPQRLVSEPCGPPVGDPGLTSSARSAAALCQAPEVEPC